MSTTTYKLENENIKIAVASKGAELKSVFNKLAQQEFLWQGNPEYWGKSSPILFPIVGTLKDGMYIYKGKEYQLPRHGFARDYNFNVEQISDTQLIFSLEPTTETLKIYPFLFQLQIVYTLGTDRLKIDYKVKNLSDTESMYFSLGAHPAFKVGDAAQDFSNYSLLFNKDNELKANLLSSGLLTHNQNTITLHNQKLNLDYKLFANDALVLLDMKSDKLTLANADDEALLTFELKNFPYFGIWTVKDSGFICLEPWSGISDFETHNRSIEAKAGINNLQPKELWSGFCTISIPNVTLNS